VRKIDCTIPSGRWRCSGGTCGSRRRCGAAEGHLTPPPTSGRLHAPPLSRNNCSGSPYTHFGAGAPVQKGATRMHLWLREIYVLAPEQPTPLVGGDAAGAPAAGGSAAVHRNSDTRRVSVLCRGFRNQVNVRTYVERTCCGRAH